MTTIYWLRNDLRIHDNECITKAAELGQPLLIVYFFDMRHYAMDPLGFRKTGYLRFKFLCESIVELRKAYQDLGFNIFLQIGYPEEIIPLLIEQQKASHLIYQKEIASEEVSIEEQISSALSGTSCKIIQVWGKTLYHIEDAPFAPNKTPLTSKTFRIKLTKNADVRPVIDLPSKLPPPTILHDWGVIPTCAEIGFEKRNDSSSSNYIGGESKGLERLQHYSFGSQQLTSYRWTRNKSLGLEYSSKFSPWMAIGALSKKNLLDS